MHTDTPFLSRLSPVPSFPAYSGPYTVGTQDVEIPVSELSSSAPAPDPQVSTISFRLFYPCEPEKRAKSVFWLPEPQGEYLRAYYRFMQASPWLASLLSYIPFFRLIHYTTIPAIRNATPLQPLPENEGRWPVMIFSHGLGGTRNSYSHICGSLASHGLVVVAPEHRDGSAPISFIKEAADSKRTSVHYASLPHEPNLQVEEGRDLQLKIRCWELGLVHDALLKLDKGATLTNIQTSRSAEDHLIAFQYLLDVHRPGKISWAGHSFGASTIVQFVKSIFYGNSPLYAATQSSALSEQITPSSPTTLLDLWTLPLLFNSTSSLWAKPLPAYSTSKALCQTTPLSPPLAILSEGFFKWSSNLRNTLRAVSPPASHTSNIQPHVFYPIASAHLSQSDFGLLFPWITKKALKAEEPERTLRLNARAILESLRRSGISVAATSKLDMEIMDDHKSVKVPESPNGVGLARGQDQMILDTTDGSVRDWIAIDPSSFILGQQRY